MSIQAGNVQHKIIVFGVVVNLALFNVLDGDRILK